MNFAYKNIHRSLLEDFPHQNPEKTGLGISGAAISIAAAAVISIFIIFIYKSFGGLNSESNQRPAAAAASSPSLELAAVSVFSYKAPTSPAPSKCCSSESEDCAICLAEFVDGEVVRVLPRCKHMFHKDCIDKWIPRLSSRCPVCRDAAVEQEVTPTTANCRTNIPPAAALLLLNFSNAPTIPSFI